MNCRQLLDNHDWANTVLGDPAGWNDSLRATVSICMQHPEPALILWGKEQIIIYNDAYALQIGDKHPEVFGMTSRKGWPNQWALRGKIAQRVLLEGKPYRIENFKMSVPLDGVKEDRYFTSTYSPILISSGIGGIFVSSRDTTDLVLQASQLRSFRIGQLRDLFNQSPVAMAVVIGPEFIVEVANDAILEIWGRNSKKVMGKSVFAAIPEARHQGFEELLTKVLTTGERLVFEKIPFRVTRKGKTVNTVLKLVYSPLREADGSITGVIVFADEITDRVYLDKRIEEIEETLRMTVQSTGMGTWEYDLLTNVFSTSDECRIICGMPESERYNYPVFASVIFAEDWRRIHYAIAKASVTRTAKFSIIHRIVRYDDHAVRWVQSWGKILLNKEGKPIKFLGTLIDITDERESESSQRRNDAQIKLAVDTSGLGTFEYSENHKLFECSEKCRELFGINSDERPDISDFESRIYEEDKKVRKIAYEEVERTGVLFYEARVVHPDHSVRWIRVDGVAVPGTRDRPSKMYGLVRDITSEKVKPDSGVHQNGVINHGIFGEIEDYAIISLSTDGIVQNWNAGAEKIKQYTKSEVIGKHFSIFFLDKDQRLPELLIAEADEKGKATHEGWVVKKDGTTFWGSTVLTKLRDVQGNGIGFSKVTLDLSDRKFLENKLRLHNSELALRNEELIHFAGIASRELQESLQKIQTLSGHAQSSISDAAHAIKYLDKIDESVQRMQQLVRATNTFRSFDRNEADIVMVDLNKLFLIISDNLALVIQVKRAIVRVYDLPVVSGSAVQIEQLFTNIIANSLKFSETIPVVEVSSRTVPRTKVVGNPDHLTEEAYFEITVRDNGIGFDPRTNENLFGLFERHHDHEKFEGTGVGLALCKKIIDYHRGHIAAKSIMGKGTDFFIYFPLVTSEAVSAKLADAPGKAITPPALHVPVR